jgi:hypothetical protein
MPATHRRHAGRGGPTRSRHPCRARVELAGDPDAGGRRVARLARGRPRLVCSRAWWAPRPTATASPPRRSPPARRRCWSSASSTSTCPRWSSDDVRRALGHVAAAVHGHPATLDDHRGSRAPTARRPRRTCWPPRSLGRVGGPGARHAVGRPDHPEATDLQRTSPGGATGRHGGDGGVVARARAAPGRRHALRRRGVHEPRSRPPRPARTDGGVLPGQGVAVHARADGASAWSTPTTPRPAAARRRRRPDAHLLADDATDVSRGRRPSRFRWRGTTVTCRSAATSTSRTRSPRSRVRGPRVDLDAPSRGSPPRRPVPGRFELVGGDLDPASRCWSTTPTRPTAWRGAGVGGAAVARAVAA